MAKQRTTTRTINHSTIITRIRQSRDAMRQANDHARDVLMMIDLFGGASALPDPVLRAIERELDQFDLWGATDVLRRLIRDHQEQSEAPAPAATNQAKTLRLLGTGSD